MYVIATAGHVDHGKSTLIRALTGMEPDRWAEERRRGMTIDLGYAWTRLDDGVEVAFVDVPGHERFATNMLAGVGPVPAVLLVIAADSGWAAQTEDHVRALDALGVRHGLVAVTRSDLADPAPAVDEAEDRLAETTLAGARIVAVSGATGMGLDELRAGLRELVAQLPAPDPQARIRFWIDRSFTIKGSGTVVTGTLQAGTLHQGDTLELRGSKVTVRTLQSLGAPISEVRGTARVAVNLRGIASDEVGRGDALLTPGAWHATDIVDVRVDADDTPTQPVVHVGSAAVPARARKLGGDAHLLRLRLAAPLPLSVGDRLLLRDPGRRSLVGGATVLDAAPPELTRRGAARRRAEELVEDTGAPDLAHELARRGAAPAALLEAVGVATADPLPPEAVRAGAWLVDRSAWQRWLDELHTAVEASSNGALLRSGVPRADLVRTLALPEPRLLDPLLAAAADLEQVDGRVRRRGAVAGLRPDLARAVERLEALLRDEPFAAPEKAALQQMGLGPRELGAVAASGAVLRLPGDVVLLPDAPQRAAECLRTLPQPFSMSTARQALNTSRRVAVPLLEHLDAAGVTQRVDGGLRRLRSPDG
ncbi:MAG: selenocysteine-specific translation elongation factor [Candidatus Dormibacteraeota bacterium]|nr:selenocysteine-specific translation elongation factor [Candidatus Dormibacteraeota bacterium]